MFSRPVSSALNPVPTSSRLPTRPRNSYAPLGRLGDAAEDLQKRALAGPVAADDADDLPSLYLEVHVSERPELLDFIALQDLPAAHHVEALACDVADFAADHVTQRDVAPVALVFSVMRDEVAFGQAFGRDYRFRHDLG